MEKKTKNKELQEKLFKKRQDAWKGNEKKILDFSEKYKEFLFRSKTERTATRTIIKFLESYGFKNIETQKKLKLGDKVYLNQKEKSVIAAIIGDENIRLVGAHTDSPRLDLKPNPLYESNGVALMKTHYYGGIKKYLWTNIDLALYGVIHTKSGKKLEFSFGEKDDEPKFMTSDLLPHLARKQMEKTGKEVIEGEQLNVFVGNIPIEDKEIKDKVKFNILKKLDKEYGLCEDDFSFAELCFVPAGTPSDIGFDRSMIAAYGHDDKSCTFTALHAFIDSKKAKHTSAIYFSDKEEIGSAGNTGAESLLLLDFAEMLKEKAGFRSSPKGILRNAKAVSSDVSTAFNPNFPEVYDEQNTSMLGYGMVIEKYTGSGGKYDANDASAEYMNEIRQILLKNNIRYQTGELGKIDIGGGGTIAKYLSRYGMDTVDAGIPVVGMHSPREIISKADLYEAYRFYKAFYEK